MDKMNILDIPKYKTVRPNSETQWEWNRALIRGITHGVLRDRIDIEGDNGCVSGFAFSFGGYDFTASMHNGDVKWIMNFGKTEDAGK